MAKSLENLKNDLQPYVSSLQIGKINFKYSITVEKLLFDF